MFGLTFEKLLVVLVLAAVIVGPHRLPLYAQRLGAVLRGIRSFVEATRARVETEVGATLAVDEWRSLDPRQYDPRRIVREALAAPAASGATAPGITTTTSDAGGVGDPDAARDATVTGAGSALPPDGSERRVSAAERERANRIAAASPGGWRPPATPSSTASHEGPRRDADDAPVS